MKKLSAVAWASGAILIVIAGAWAAAGLVRPSPGKIVPTEASITRLGLTTREAQAPIEFELRNVGGRPVRILSVESSCGCATPTVRPTLVAPGGRAVVSVVALIPAVGESTANLGVHTDSPVTPRVGLALRVSGARKPPYVNGVFGEVQFVIDGDPPPGESRTISIQTIEPMERTRTPVVRCDLPFIRLTPGPVKERPRADDDACFRNYEYRVELASRPPVGMHTGSIIVEDPWDPVRIQDLAAFVEVRPLLRAAPGRLTLDRASGGGPAKLLIVGRDAAGPIRVMIAGEASGAFAIDPVETDEVPPKSRLFTVGLRAGAAVPDGTYRLVVSGGDGAGPRITVPVEVRGGRAER